MCIYLNKGYCVISVIAIFKRNNLNLIIIVLELDANLMITFQGVNKFEI